MGKFREWSLWIALLLAVFPAVGEDQLAGSFQDRESTIVDRADQDGWETEVFQAAATDQLKKLSKLLHDSLENRTGELAAFCTPENRSTSLVPGTMKTDYQSAVLRVRSWPEPETQKSLAVGEALGNLADSLSECGDLRFHFKIFQVNPLGGNQWESDQWVSIAGNTASGSMEINAVWRIVWETGEKKSAPLIHELGLREFEQVDFSYSSTRVKTAGATALTDLTESVFGPASVFPEQLSRGLDHWSQRISFADTNGYQGLAIGDVNGDGLEDVYLCQTGGLPNRLLLTQPDGTVKDYSRQSGTAWMERSRGALFADFDNDGDPDLAVTLSSALVIMENDGTGKFKLRREIVDAGNTFSLSAADYDNDGLLDLYVCVYYVDGKFQGLIANPSPYYDANNGGRNLLLRNRGKFRFFDVTKETGLDEPNRRFSLAASWEDFDNDGDPDLYVANDFGRNCLFVNEGGKFENQAAAFGVEDSSFGMSASWGDSDRDGDMDLYVSNMWSSAGNRVTFQNRFRTADGESLRNRYQYLARGNSLFLNGQSEGRPDFLDESASAGVMRGRWAWSSQFVDLDQDSRLDLLVANGYVTRENAYDDL